MTYELITNRNLSEGVQVLFVYANDITGGVFIKMLLFAIWMIVAFGLYFAQKKSVGTGDFPMSIAVASFVTMVITFLMRLITGLVDIYTATVVFVIFIATLIYFLFHQE